MVWWEAGSRSHRNEDVGAVGVDHVQAIPHAQRLQDAADTPGQQPSGMTRKPSGVTWQAAHNVPDNCLGPGKATR